MAVITSDCMSASNELRERNAIEKALCEHGNCDVHGHEILLELRLGHDAAQEEVSVHRRVHGVCTAQEASRWAVGAILLGHPNVNMKMPQQK